MFKRNWSSALNKPQNYTLTFWGFVAPMVLGLLVFTYVPIIWGGYLSLHEARNTVRPQEFVGLQNYVELLKNPSFIDSLRTGTLFAIFIIPVTYVLSLWLALLINNLPRGEGFFRTVIFIPTAVSYVIASVVWKMSLFNGLPSGFMNNILWYSLEMDPIAWVNTTQPPLYWLVLITVRLWLQVGFFMIILLAGLKEIPETLYEAASVDGAKPGWQTFRYITFPMLRNTSVSVILLIMIQAFQAFDEFRNILTANAANAGGGNAILARPPLVYLYSIAFGDQNYGRGSAGAFIVMLLIVLVTVFQARIFGFGNRED